MGPLNSIFIHPSIHPAIKDLWWVPSVCQGEQTIRPGANALDLPSRDAADLGVAVHNCNPSAQEAEATLGSQ